VSFDHFSILHCGDCLLIIRSTHIHHIVSIKIGHRLSSKLFLFSIEVVHDLFKVSIHPGFHLGEELNSIFFLVRLHNLSLRVHYLIHLAYKFQQLILKARIWLRRWYKLRLLLWSWLILRGIWLLIELRICLMVQFMNSWSIILRSLSLSRDIRLVAPSRVIGFTVRFISWSRELCVHMLIRIVRKLSCSRTIFNMVIRTVAIWTWSMGCWNASPYELN